MKKTKTTKDRRFTLADARSRIAALELDARIATEERAAEMERSMALETRLAALESRPVPEGTVARSAAAKAPAPAEDAGLVERLAKILDCHGCRGIEREEQVRRVLALLRSERRIEEPGLVGKLTQTCADLRRERDALRAELDEPKARAPRKCRRLTADDAAFSAQIDRRVTESYVDHAAALNAAGFRRVVGGAK